MKNRDELELRKLIVLYAKQYTRETGFNQERQEKDSVYYMRMILNYIDNMSMQSRIVDNG